MNYGDRVQETTTTTGTGTLSLSGATTGHLSFVAEIGTTNTCTYLIEAEDGAWEIGTGTVTAGTPNTLSRGFLKSSTGSVLTLAAGTHTVSAVASAKDFISPRPTDIQQPEYNIGNLGATPTISVTNGNCQRGVINASPTITLATPASGAAFIRLHMTVDATGGYAITWASAAPIGGTAPDFDMTANAKNIAVLIYANGAWSVDGGST